MFRHNIIFSEQKLRVKSEPEPRGLYFFEIRLIFGIFVTLYYKHNNQRSKTHFYFIKWIELIEEEKRLLKGLIKKLEK